MYTAFEIVDFCATPLSVQNMQLRHWILETIGITLKILSRETKYKSTQELKKIVYTIDGQQTQ